MFEKDGIVIIENFLSQETLEKKTQPPCSGILTIEKAW
jgi:hypothetical protein